MRAPAVGGVRNIERIGHCGDFQALGCAASSTDVWLHDVDRPTFEEVAELALAKIVLAACDSDIKGRPEFGKVRVIVGAKRFLESEATKFLVHASAPDRFRYIEDLVRIDHQPPVVADD